ncbi:helix-turn-helix domain-containing protein [uncultured Dubosiella sp.]|uniref:winged helix-turn-helix transcriptional regulator n=2 Tax=uncultured Dubosiella sp. TaxID=1937011 RepID=UPI002080856C|nr:helix-turn-helix domain-containing protein [uncultured Dubosiella sp.]GJM58066.1 HxlR family transcriptional regulator [Erysipelotrichaceae bacterium OPF54]
MNEKRAFTNEMCPMRVACRTLEGKWKIPMIYVLCEHGTLRYNELKKALGITNVMLSNTLKEMEQEGLIIRIQFNEIPPRVEYSLTEVALKLMPILQEFYEWGELLIETEDRR